MNPMHSLPSIGIISASVGGENFPILRLNGDQSAKMGLSKCRVGEEYDVKLRVKITDVAQEKGKPGNAVGLEVVSSETPEPVGEAEAPEQKKVRGKIQLGPKDAGMKDAYSEDEQSQGDMEEDAAEGEMD